jgi:hypothetical protein
LLFEVIFAINKVRVVENQKSHKLSPISNYW